MRISGGDGELAAERACARHGAEQAMQMPGDGVQVRSRCKLACDVSLERRRRLMRGGAGSLVAERLRIDGEQSPWFLIRSTTQHHAVDVRQMHERLINAGNAAIDDDRQARMLNLEPIDARVIERRNFAVLPWATGL